ncbi:uncharacterized protein [Watersipora subatra]|uniref:uncharacterized protein n=1 Tax=Watersipora subatra TaxID=2589382 RepID=UPI00355C9385
MICLMQDYWASATQCPMKYFTHKRMHRPRALNGSLYNGGPGVLMTNTKVGLNDTHLVIASGMQFLGYIATQETKFYLQLRNPTDRVISYLFHWQKERRIPQYKQMSARAFTSQFVEYLLKKLLDDLKKCLAVNGEVTCVYLPDSHDGNLETLLTHSLYVVFLEEIFKFVPQEQVLVKTLDEYSKNRVTVVNYVVKDFFGVDVPDGQYERKNHQQVLNRGRKKAVWKSTLEMLDNFFAPYNRRLAELLRDEKWLFNKTRT